jgi:uncharacterized membrane protein
MATLILGAFQDQSDANKAIVELERLGALSDDFSLIMRDKSDYTGNFRETLTESGPARVANEVAAGGVTVGGLAGLIGGAIAAAGLFVAGPVVLLAGLGWVALTTVAGGLVGAAAGGVVGALIGLGVPEDTAKRHEAVIKRGGAILGVQDSAISKSQARDVLEENGAEEVVDIAHSPLSAKVTAN